MHLHYTLASALFIGTALSFPISRTHAAPQKNFISRSPILKHGQNSRSSVGDIRGGGLADAYNTQLEKRPILTKSFTCLVIASIGTSEFSSTTILSIFLSCFLLPPSLTPAPSTLVISLGSQVT